MEDNLHSCKLIFEHTALVLLEWKRKPIFIYLSRSDGMFT